MTRLQPQPLPHLNLQACALAYAAAAAAVPLEAAATANAAAVLEQCGCQSVCFGCSGSMSSMSALTFRLVFFMQSTNKQCQAQFLTCIGSDFFLDLCTKMFTQKQTPLFQGLYWCCL